MGMSIERAQSIIQAARRNIAYFQEVNKQEKTEMSIEEHQEHLLDIMDSMPDDACGDWRDSLAYAIETMRKYQQLQADYENRLKADMVAMLEDLRLDFQEAELAGVIDNKELIFADEVDDLVQQKINALKENSHDD